MKITKTILLISFLLLLGGIYGKAANVFENAELALFSSFIILLITGIVYGILALIAKQNRTEASMLVLAYPLLLGILFSLMRWPAGGILVVMGSSTILMGSIAIFIYTVVKNQKLVLGVFYVAIGFGSLFFCFKFMRWPGADLLFFPCAAVFMVAIVLFVVKGTKLETSHVVSFLIAGLLTLVFFSSSSELYRMKYLNLLKPENNFPENYYTYSWILHSEGKNEEAKRNLQLAIQEANNLNNFHADWDGDRVEMIERYERAMALLSSNAWNICEKAPNHY